MSVVGWVLSFPRDLPERCARIRLTRLYWIFAWGSPLGAQYSRKVAVPIGSPHFRGEVLTMLVSDMISTC